MVALAFPADGQQASPAFLLFSLFAVGASIQPYCESTEPGTGTAIAHAMAAIRREQPKYVAWMEEEPIYEGGLKFASEAVAKDPQAYVKELKDFIGVSAPCQGLAAQLESIREPLAAELKLKADDLKLLYSMSHRKVVRRKPYSLVPPDGAAQVTADSLVCRRQSQTPRPLTDRERTSLLEHPTEDFLAGLRLNADGYPFAAGGEKMDASNPMTDWYVFCLLSRGYTWREEPDAK
jgi:hypothetical protein